VGPNNAEAWQLALQFVRISKTAEVRVVADAAAFGKLYVSPISLARFEEDAGSINKSTVRHEGHAAFGVER